MKKIFIGIGVLICLYIGLTFLIPNNYKEIKYKELIKKIDNKENFVLTLSSTTCPNCLDFKETIKQVNNKYDIKTYYINFDKLNNEEKAKIDELFPFTGTPTTVNVVNGKEQNELSRIVGSSNYLAIKEKLISWNYIKE